MTAAPPLPFFTSGEGDRWLACPWCNSYGVDQATVTIEKLAFTHEHGQLARWVGGPGQTADACDLTADCPDCGKPFTITLRKHHDGQGYVRLDPVRTAADARLLTGG